MIAIRRSLTFMIVSFDLIEKQILKNDVIKHQMIFKKIHNHTENFRKKI